MGDTMADQAVARWESKSGKHWLEVYADQWGGAYFRAPGAGGSRGSVAEAIAWCELHSGDFQPDANKTPMVRVF